MGIFWKNPLFVLFQGLKIIFWLVWRFGLMYNSKILHSCSILTCFDTKNIFRTQIWRQAFFQIFANINLFNLEEKSCFWCLNRLKLNQNEKFCYYTPSQTFKLVQKIFLSPKKARKMDFFQKFPTVKVTTHLKTFLGAIQYIWQGQNACDKKKIQHLLEAQCVR